MFHTSFNLIEHELSASSPNNTKTEELHHLEGLYAKVRQCREMQDSTVDLAGLVASIEQSYSEEWLLLLEIYELVQGQEVRLSDKVLRLLNAIKVKRKNLIELIEEGVRLVPVTLEN